MDLAEILRVIHPGGCLNDIVAEMLADTVCLQKLLTCHCCRRQKVQIIGGLGERGEWKIGRIVHFEERADGLLHKILCTNGRVSVFPEQLGDVPVLVAVIALGEDELVPVPDTEDFCSAQLAGGSHAPDGQAKRFCCIYEVAVDLDENGGTHFDGKVGVVVGVDGDRAASHIVIALVDSDIDALARGLEGPEVICC